MSGPMLYVHGRPFLTRPGVQAWFEGQKPEPNRGVTTAWLGLPAHHLGPYVPLRRPSRVRPLGVPSR